jgi:hypothetical protein
MPTGRTAARENRAFLGRVVRYLAAGRTAYIPADLRDPASILSNPVAREVIDFSRPVALMLVAILRFIEDQDHPAEIIKTLVDALPPGSFVAASHLTGEHDRDAWATIEADYRAGISAQWRDSDEFAQLAFTGLEMVPRVSCSCPSGAPTSPACGPRRSR